MTININHSTNEIGVSGSGTTISPPLSSYAALRLVTPIAGKSIRIVSGSGGIDGDFYAVTGAAAGTYVDNGGTIIVPTGGDGSAAWLRDYSGKVNVIWFGAKGDGVTDDTTPVQSAINFVSANRYKELYAPKGTYLGNWTVTSDTKIVGDGIGSTSFKALTNAPVFRTSALTNVVRLSFRMMTIYGSVAQNAQDAISLYPQANGTFVDTVTIEDVAIGPCGRYGIYTNGTNSVSTFVQNLRLNRVTIQGCLSEGFYADGIGYEWAFNNVTITANGSTTIPNCTFGSKTRAGESPNRITWIAGGVNKAGIDINARYVTDVVTTAASAVITSATANFTTNDVGKTIVIDNGNSSKHPIITTILSYTSATQVTLSANVNVTNAGGVKAIINPDMSGAIQINHAKQIKMIGLDIEWSNIPVVINGSLTHDVSIDTCRFGITVPVVATIFMQGTGGEGFSFINCREGYTGGSLYGFMHTAIDGSGMGLSSQTKGIRYESLATFGVSQIILFQIQSISANNLYLYQPYISMIFVNGAAGTVNSLLDTNGVTSLLPRGKPFILFANTSFTVAHNVGNIFLNGGVNVTLNAGQTMTLMWDDFNAKWYQA